MKQHYKVLIAVLALANILVVAWALLRHPTEAPPQTLGEAVQPLVADPTMEKERYNLAERAQELNVILISMDALRWDRTGLSGNKSGLTPNLDAFADEAVVFHDAVAAASWTLPSHMSVWTARWPSVHQITNKLRLLAQDQMVPTQLSPGIETFPDVLIRQGWNSVGFTGGAGLQATYGFGRNFKQYLDDRPFAGLDYSMPPAIEWLQKNRDQRFFMFLHGYDSHGQFPLPESEIQAIKGSYKGALNGSIEENARMREAALATIRNPGDRMDYTGSLGPEDSKFMLDIYNKKVRDADQRLGTFLGQLRTMNLLDSSIVVIMSDHGDEFMEHKGLDHGATLYEELEHVVLMMRFPGYARRNDVKQTVRLLDVFPTIFAALGIDPVPGADGQSLLPMMRGEKQDLEVFAETDYRLFVHLRMVRRGQTKLVLDLSDGRKELFDLKADPNEQNDISSSDPKSTYELEQKLRAWMDRTRTNPQDYLGLKQKPITIF